MTKHHVEMAFRWWADSDLFYMLTCIVVSKMHSNAVIRGRLTLTKLRLSARPKSR